jgi:hypothetical protein
MRNEKQEPEARRKENLLKPFSILFILDSDSWLPPFVSASVFLPCLKIIDSMLGRWHIVHLSRIGLFQGSILKFACLATSDGFVVLFERRFRMGTKPMVFPLDADGRVYALHNENDEQICAGSRETCYRLLELMLQVKRRADESQLAATDSIQSVELPSKAASAASSS